MEKGHAGLQYLEEAIKIFKEWRTSGKQTLTKETFTGCIQSMEAVPALTKHLQDHHDFEYLLAGKVMSDPIEGRFGWYRQVNGGNFFMSVKQLLQAEKKIRCLSLLQQQLLLNASHLDTLPLLNRKQIKTVSNLECQELTQLFSEFAIDDIVNEDTNIIYYVSGFIGRSMCRRRKCGFCKKVLLEF